MKTHHITILAAGPGHFDVAISDRILCRRTDTPFRDSARALLAAGLAQANDTLVMRFADTKYTVLESTVAKAARLAETAQATPAAHFRAASWS
jgi:hypothetical protein